MIPMTLAEIAEAVGGEVVDGAAEPTVTAEASVDSRAVPAGGLFVAMAGENADGHDFAAAAVEAGRGRGAVPPARSACRRWWCPTRRRRWRGSPRTCSRGCRASPCWA